jgi:hypothetical protein
MMKVHSFKKVTMQPTPRQIALLSNYYRPKLFDDAFSLLSEGDNTIQYQDQCYNPVVIQFPGGKKNTPCLHAFVDEWSQANKTPPLKPDNIHIVQLNNYQSTDKYQNPGEYFLKQDGINYLTGGKNYNATTF